MTVPDTQMPDRGPILVSMPPPWISVIPRKQAEAGNISAPQVVDTPRGGHAPFRQVRNTSYGRSGSVACRHASGNTAASHDCWPTSPTPRARCRCGRDDTGPARRGARRTGLLTPHQRARSSPRLGHDRCSRAHVPSNGRDAACVVLLPVSLLSSVQHRHRVGMQLGTVARLAAVVLPCSTPHLLNHEQTPHGPARHRLRSAR